MPLERITAIKDGPGNNKTISGDLDAELTQLVEAHNQLEARIATLEKYAPQVKIHE